MAPPSTRRRSCRRRRRRRNNGTPPSPARPPKNAEPPPAIPTPAATRPAKWPPPAAQLPAATHQRPSRPDTLAAGLGTFGGGPVAASCVPCPPATPHTQCRRRRYRLRRQSSPSHARPTRVPPVMPTPAAGKAHGVVDPVHNSPRHAGPPPRRRTPAQTATSSPGPTRPPPVSSTPAAGLPQSMQDPPLAHLVPVAGYACPVTRSCTAGVEAAGTRDTAFAAAKAADGTDQFLEDPLLTTVSKERKTLRSKEIKKPFKPPRRAQEAYSFPPPRVQQGDSSGARASPRPVPLPKRSSRDQNVRQEARRPAR